MLTLRITPRGKAARNLAVEGREALVGRSSRAEIALRDLAMSRRHARFFSEAKSWFIEDLGSRNGTFINGSRVVRPTSITLGDTVTVGTTTITVTQLAARQPASAEISSAEPISGETLFRPVSDLLRKTGESDALPAHADSATLRRTLARLQMLNEIHDALGRSIELEELLELILERAFEHLRPELGLILLREPSGEYRRAAARGGSAALELPTSQSLIHEVVEKRQAAMVIDATTDQRFSASQSMVAAGIRSLLAAPLLSPDSALGLIILSSNVAVRQHTEEDLDLLVSLASVAALRLHNVHLAEAAAERKQLQKELALARRIQAALFPEALPSVPGYQIEARNLPSRGVSGDLYLVVERDSELVFMVADVSGKGIAASLLTASIEALAAGLIEDGHEPAMICSRLSERLYRRTTPERFATALVVSLDAERGAFSYASAGHNPALLVTGGSGDRWLGATGVPLGLLDDQRYDQGTGVIEPGDTLLLYTDGLTEAFDSNGEEYGEDRLAAVAGSHHQLGADHLVQAITADHDRHAGELARADDRTLVVIHRRLP